MNCKSDAFHHAGFKPLGCCDCIGCKRRGGGGDGARAPMVIRCSATKTRTMTRSAEGAEQQGDEQLRIPREANPSTRPDEALRVLHGPAVR